MNKVRCYMGRVIHVMVWVVIVCSGIWAQRRISTQDLSVSRQVVLPGGIELHRDSLRGGALVVMDTIEVLGIKDGGVRRYLLPGGTELTNIAEVNSVAISGNNGNLVDIADLASDMRMYVQPDSHMVVVSNDQVSTTYPAMQVKSRSGMYSTTMSVGAGGLTLKIGTNWFLPAAPMLTFTHFKTNNGYTTTHGHKNGDWIWLFRAMGTKYSSGNATEVKGYEEWSNVKYVYSDGDFATTYYMKMRKWNTEYEVMSIDTFGMLTLNYLASYPAHSGQAKGILFSDAAGKVLHKMAGSTGQVLGVNESGDVTWVNQVLPEAGKFITVTGNVVSLGGAPASGTTVLKMLPSGNATRIELLAGSNTQRFISELSGFGKTLIDQQSSATSIKGEYASGQGVFSFDFTPFGVAFTDQRATKVGIEYGADYTADLKTNDRSLADVGTVKELISDSLATFTGGGGSSVEGGRWELRQTDAILFDDFTSDFNVTSRYGDMGLTGTVSGGATFSNEADTVGLGMLRFKGHSTNIYGIYLSHGTTQTTTPSRPVTTRKSFVFETRVRFLKVYAIPQGYVYCGLVGGSSGIVEPDKGIYFYFGSSGVAPQARSRNTATTTINGPVINNSPPKWITLRIEFNHITYAATYSLKVDNGAWQTIGTISTNIPTVNDRLRVEIGGYDPLGNGGGNGLEMVVDYIYFRQSR
ncbi:MAG: hypothetical protein KatS3mg054_0058 [Chloroflexus sp.]|nr:MAG: hypothetical protein KatS3mg054_0058 [Chloroflexus sp.]